MPGRWLLLVSLLLAPVAIGCEAEIPEGRFACLTDEDCPPDLVCRTNVGRCFRTPSADDAPDGG